MKATLRTTCFMDWGLTHSRMGQSTLGISMKIGKLNIKITVVLYKRFFSGMFD